MVDVDGLSDAEIRTKLIEFGFPVMPITGTTRKVMIKKLKLLTESKGKSGSADRRSLAQFSSEEESDTDVRVTRKDRNRRATMAVPPMQPPVTSKVTQRKNSKRVDADVIEVSKPVVREERKATTRTTKIMNMVERDNDTNSDSEPDIVETDYKISTKNHYDKRDSPIQASITSSTFSYSTPKGYTPPKQLGSASPSRASYMSQSPSRISAYQSPSDGFDALNQIRSRLSLGGNDIAYSPTIDEPRTEGHQTPFLSNFTKRLSQLSSSPVNKNDYDLKTDVIKERDTNGASSIYTRSYLASRPKPRYYTREYQTAQERSARGNNISVILIGSVALFFIILAALYWGMHSGNNSSDILGLNVPYCDVKDSNAVKGENCITEDDLQGTLDFYKVIKPLLIKCAIDNKCSDENIKPYKTEEDIVSFIQENYGIKDEFVIREDMRNFAVLLYKNPAMEVSILMSRNREFSKSDKVNTIEKVLEKSRDDYTAAFAVLDPSLPLSCSVYILFTTFARAVVIILAITTTWFAGKHGYKHYRYYEQRRKNEIVLMVERIIDLLQANASEEGDNFLVINHVRDMILPIDNRKKMESTWIKAVKFINEHESRVRTEVQVVKGEPYEVWRWVGGHNTSTARNKSWQGQAFETQIGSVNSPPCSPTPCLKVRGMVDDGDRNLHTIREAVLVKCAEQCRILHCAVDINSKCVYLKCADQNEAAIAYRNLHGWWYASHLVTVKYLRLERYMQRFPDSPQSGPPFLQVMQPAKDWSI